MRDYFVYILVTLDYLYVYIVMRDYIFLLYALKRAKNADNYIHYYISVYMKPF